MEQSCTWNGAPYGRELRMEERPAGLVRPAGQARLAGLASWGWQGAQKGVGTKLTLIRQHEPGHRSLRGVGKKIPNGVGSRRR